MTLDRPSVKRMHYLPENDYMQLSTARFESKQRAISSLTVA